MRSGSTNGNDDGGEECVGTAALEVLRREFGGDEGSSASKRTRQRRRSNETGVEPQAGGRYFDGNSSNTFLNFTAQETSEQRLLFSEERRVLTSWQNAKPVKSSMS